MANDNGIIQEITEVKNLLAKAIKAMEELERHPSYGKVIAFGDLLHMFTMGQGPALTENDFGAAPQKRRTRRTAAQIAADAAPYEAAVK